MGSLQLSSTTFTILAPFTSLSRDTQFVVAVACGMTVGDRHYELGERIPREAFGQFTLHSLYNLRRITVAPAPNPPVVSAVPEPVVLEASPPIAPAPELRVPPAPTPVVVKATQPVASVAVSTARPMPGPVRPPRR